MTSDELLRAARDIFLGGGAGLVSYQQDQETAMREAPTLEALEAIPVDYDSVPLPGGETA